MKNLWIITIALLIVQCEPIVPQTSTLKKQIFFKDYEYELNVGNVAITPVSNGQVNLLGNPVIKLNSNDQLRLEFDLLTDQFENLSAKIYHCNEDWSNSQLRDLEFMEGINNTRIPDFDYSVNTSQPYINYRFMIPTPILSGNYVVAIFRRSNPDDLILTRRFIVFESRATINHLVRVSTTITEREKNHHVEFDLDIGDTFTNSPTQEIRVTVLQNHNWNTAKTNIPPTQVRANEGYLEYKPLDLSTNFLGWNDFRFIDLRTLTIVGRNVAKITSQNERIITEARTDRSRLNLSYSQNLQDINGGFIIQNNDPGEIMLNADYSWVRFYLNSEKIEGKVFLIGRYNDWNLDNSNEMQYNNELKGYNVDLYLKQGYYEYLYYVDSEKLPPYYLEGSHFQSENTYEILVYYRRPGNIHDEIIGYKKFSSRP